MEDAGVFSLADAAAQAAGDTVLVQTVDFITPVLDDPYAFGQAAAANSLSDIYAMGARPVTALNLVAFPADRLRRPARSARPGADGPFGPEVLAAILRGGRDKLTEAGVALLGGHSIDDPEPKYGLAVTGLARRSELLFQSGGRPGDVLFLTKPIGGGLLTTALKLEGLPPADLAEFTAVLTTLNAYGRDAALAAGATAATDVTGFGLLGHLSNLVLASGVGAEIEAAAVPVIPAALALASRGPASFPGGAARNLAFVASRVNLTFSGGQPGEVTGEGGQPGAMAAAGRRLLLADPMTSGGLLVAVPPEQAARFAEVARAGLKQKAKDTGYWCSRIGRLTDRPAAIAVALG